MKKLKSFLSIILSVAIILPSVIFFQSPKMGVTAEETEQSGTENTDNTENTEDINDAETSDNDNIIYVSDTARTYICDGFTVDYSYSALWNGDRSISLTITNTDSETIENWALLYDFGGDVTNIWGGAVHTTNGGVQFLDNSGYNADLAPNQSAYIGYTLTGATANFPEIFRFIQHRVERVDGYTANLNITSIWDNNINGTITITNMSDTPVRNWELAFASNFNISDSWVAGISIIETPVGYRLKGVTNTTIAAGANVSLSFAGTIEDSSLTPEISNVVLTEVTALDYEPIDYELDSDGDGLPDYIEDEIGTDKYNADTDGDGLPDGYEYDVLGTDPLLADTDGNDISDADEDFDYDELSNLQEFSLETNPFAMDTDDDGFTDGDEVNIYNTNPLIFDAIVLNEEIINGIHDNSLIDLQNLNANLEYPLDVYENDDCTHVVSVRGKYSDIVVENPKDALYSMYSVKDLIGLTDPQEQLELYKVNFSEAATSYKFLQKYNELPVDGRVITVVAGADGETLSFTSSLLVDIEDDIDITAELTADDINSELQTQLGADITIDNEGLTIFTSDDYEDNPILVYKVIAYGDNADGEYIDSTMFIDADLGDIVEEYSNIEEYTRAAGSGVNELNEHRIFPTTLGKAPYPLNSDIYYLQNLDAKINVYDDNLGLRIQNSSTLWTDATAISAYTNIQYVKSWYKDNLKRNSYDGDGAALKVYIHNNNRYNNAFWSPSEKCIKFFDNNPDSNLTVTMAGCLDVVGHEFTHAVINDIIENFPYVNATGAIKEGYADVFGYFIDPTDWTHGGERKIDEKSRDFSNPTAHEHPEKFMGENYYDYITEGLGNDNGGVHQNSTLISHPMYLMATDSVNPLSNTKLAKLFYQSIDKYDKDSDFISVRRNLISAAVELKYSNADIDTIRRAFDTVEIIDDTGNVKVTVLNGTNSISGADISLYKYNKEEVSGVTDNNGCIIFDDIEVGTYTLKVDMGTYSPIYSKVLVTKDKTTDKTVFLITASDSFAWTEYDHLNYSDTYAPTIPKHIVYQDDSIKMIGYSRNALKDFLLVEDNVGSQNVFDQKLLSFDIQRDSNNWHTMEGGGFLFNASVSNNILKGFCLLVTQGGLKLYQINGVNVNSFRNGNLGNVSTVGTLIGTYNIGDVSAAHSITLMITYQQVLVWDGNDLIVDTVLPLNDYGYGFGPITSHDSHSCGQISYFTFKNITMYNISG